MAEISRDEVIRIGTEAAREAMEYMCVLVDDMQNASEDEAQALMVAMCSCVAALQFKIIKSCSSEQILEESKSLIRAMVDAQVQGLKTQLQAPEQGKE